MLDMIELGLVGYRGLGELPGLAKRVGSKPAFVFSGEKWGREEAYRKLQNLLLGVYVCVFVCCVLWSQPVDVLVLRQRLSVCVCVCVSFRLFVLIVL